MWKDTCARNGYTQQGNKGTQTRIHPRGNIPDKGVRKSYFVYCNPTPGFITPNIGNTGSMLSTRVNREGETERDAEAEVDYRYRCAALRTFRKSDRRLSSPPRWNNESMLDPYELHNDVT